MKNKGVLFIIAVAILTCGAAYAADAKKPDTTKEGKTLFLSEKYKCFSCHGQNGEGGAGPSFKGVGKKYSAAELTKRAAHNCPPTGACSPKEIAAMVDYLRTL